MVGIGFDIGWQFAFVHVDSARGGCLGHESHVHGAADHGRDGLAPVWRKHHCHDAGWYGFDRIGRQHGGSVTSVKAARMACLYSLQIYWKDLS